MEDELLALPVAAELMGLTYSTLWRRVKANEIPSAKVGNRYGVLRSDAERYREQLRGKRGVRRPSTPAG